MRSPALAIAWEFGRRYRWGLLVLAGYILIALTTRLLVLEHGRAVSLDDPNDLPALAPRFVATVIVPLSFFTYWLLAVFSFGFTGNLAARESLYPSRMFTLPMTTTALTGWPMLYGSAVMATLWAVTARCVVLPSGVDLPLVWPPLFAVATLAWVQVLMWLPYGLPGLRVIVAVAWLVAIDAAVFMAMDRRVPDRFLVAFLGPQLPLAYLGARFGVAMARRGDLPDWRREFAWLGRLIRSAERAPSRTRRFSSAPRAQLWFEWRLHGRSLPVWVAKLLPFELAFLFVAGNATPALVAYTLAGVLVTPPFMAAFVATGARKSNLYGSDATEMSPFVATRPLTSAALIAAKMHMAVWSTLATWLLVLVAIPVALTLSGTWPTVTERAHRLIDGVGAPRAVAVALLAVLGLVASTWKRLVQGLHVGVSGREWLIRASACATLTFLILIEPTVAWMRRSSEVQVALWNGLPWILAVLVAVKVSAASWVAWRLDRARLFSERALVAGAACWLVAVLALHAVLVWLTLGPLIPAYFLLLLAILAVPLARVSAAPLALAWNRHR